MSKRQTGKQSIDPNQDEAARIAKGTQQAGQTREQTRLIARGIRKGIEQYKKQHKAKLRELDRNRKKANRKLDTEIEPTGQPDADRLAANLWKTGLPWTLLVMTWIGIGIYILLLG